MLVKLKRRDYDLMKGGSSEMFNLNTNLETKLAGINYPGQQLET